MLRAVLFDLDGTLLHVDIAEFLDAYLKALAPRVAHLVDPQRFARQLIASTGVMIADRDPARTNQQVFFDDFFPTLGIPAETLVPVFDAFYERDFGRLRAVTRSDPAARRAVVAVLDRGLDAVVATNPIFPLTAIRQRLEWAGLADLPFALVTSYETSHFCKPHPEYFLEVAGRLGRAPQECMMVGNDVDEDAAAHGLGMRTYLVTDHLINARGVAPVADHVGTLDDLAAFLERGFE